MPKGWAQLSVAFTAQLTFAKELVRPLWYVCIKKCVLVFLMVCKYLIWDVVSGPCQCCHDLIMSCCPLNWRLLLAAGLKMYCNDIKL